MKSVQRQVCWIWLLAAGFALCTQGPVVAVTQPAQEQQTGLPTVNTYFELLQAGDFEVAADLWTPEALERSSRFGIQFTGIPLKVDCASPIMRNVDLAKDLLLPPVRGYQDLDGGKWTSLEFSQMVNGEELKHTYYAQRRGDWAWLAFPQDFFAANWPVVESRFFRVHVHPDVQKYLNDAALSEADRFVQAMADTLKIPKTMCAEMALKKIEYFFCPSDTMVELITGYRSKGTLDLASNDIISSTFPHFHELLHLLVNIRLQNLPLYTLPIVREGIAVRYGGRAGRNHGALMDLGEFLYRDTLVQLDSVLTMRGFEAQAGADIVYPVAGVFAGYLIDKIGLEACLKLYLDMSGPFLILDSMTTADVKTRLTAATAQASWEELITDFDTYLDTYAGQYVTALPGGLTKGKERLRQDGVVVSDDKQWLALEFTWPAGVQPAANLLFGPVPGLSGQYSVLFDEQYGGSIPFEGYRWGVRLDKNEAGLYDYVTNQLVAKYIWGITPSDEYFDSQNNRVRIKIRKSLLDKQMPKANEVKLLPL
jgi:hypothetical protein